MTIQHIQLMGAAMAMALALGCQRGPTMQPLPRRDRAWPTAEAVLVWHGRGEAYRMKRGAWQRTPSFDYDFTVVQRRFASTWESTKTVQRRHPAYDGSAGPRAQTYHFALKYAPSGAFQLKSTLGNGNGHTDASFREASMVVDADISRFAPYNRYTIEQHYDYEVGGLSETVTLVKHSATQDKPWAKVEEVAQLFGPATFPTPPTVLRSASAFDVSKAHVAER